MVSRADHLQLLTVMSPRRLWLGWDCWSRVWVRVSALRPLGPSAGIRTEVAGSLGASPPCRAPGPRTPTPPLVPKTRRPAHGPVYIRAIPSRKTVKVSFKDIPSVTFQAPTRALVWVVSIL